MAALGLSWVRIGEFAWTHLEPTPGNLSFDWLDRAIEILGGQGLKVILGTPTATPPRWMLDRHPDMLAVDRDGQTRGFGSRRHYCFSHEGYRQEAARIVTMLAGHYGDHPTVQAWQTDNEYGCHGTTLSFSPSALAAFRVWLQERYLSIDDLNEAWGNDFWSMRYDRFDQIDLPNLTVTEASPAHWLAFRRFSSDQVVSFDAIQTEIIRKHSDRPILHNYMGTELGFDHFKLGEGLDIASWDSYPLGFLEDRVTADDDHKFRFMRQGDPDYQAFHHDLYRTVGKGRWWIMEQQPGPVNWAPYNPAPLPGMVRLWTWEAFAHGAEMVSYFRWRQARFGQEQMHSGLHRPDGVEAPAADEIRKVIEELPDRPDVETPVGDAALVFDYASAWGYQTQPQGASFSYFDLVFTWYKGLRRLGLNVDIVGPGFTDLAQYKLILAPGLMAPSAGFLSSLPSFEGTALLGPRFGSRTPDHAIPLPLPPGIPDMDCTVSFVESLRPGARRDLGNAGSYINWSERLEGTATVTLSDGDGFPAVMSNRKHHYVAGWPDDGLVNTLLGTACAAEGIAALSLPGSLRTRHDGMTRYLFNYGPEAERFDGLEIEPAGVAFLSL